MIARLASLIVLVYALGFILFAFTLGKPAGADATPTDAAVVLTGGPGRIEYAIDVLRDDKSRRLLIAGADRLLTVQEVAAIMRVSNMTVYRLIRAGDLRSARVGRGYRIRERDVEAYLSRDTAWTVPGDGA